MFQSGRRQFDHAVGNGNLPQLGRRNSVFDRFRQSGPDEKEVARARNTFETNMLQGLETLGGFGGVADTLNMFNHYVGDPGYLPKYLEEHRQVTPASVKAFAAKYLQPQTRVVVHGVPGRRNLGPNVATPPAPGVAPGTGAEAINADAPWRATQPKPAADRGHTVRARLEQRGNGRRRDPAERIDPADHARARSIDERPRPAHAV